MAQNVKLYNGYEMPIFGLGTWQSQPGEIKVAVKNALDLNYKHVDCAWAYQNEKEIGEVFEETFNDGKVKREDLFVTSKLWNAFHRPEFVAKGCQETLTNLRLEYLDLYLIHWPLAIKPGNIIPAADIYKEVIDDVDLLDTWKEMEKLVDSGKVRSIGVSNFNTKQVQNILDHCRIRPAVNQIEIHIHFPNKNLVEYCLKNDIRVTAYSPLGGNFDSAIGQVRPIEDPEVLKIAKNLNATPAQVLISYIVHRGLVCIPKSVSPARLAENLKGLSIHLSDSDFTILDNLNVNRRFCSPKVFELDKNFPFWED